MALVEGTGVVSRWAGATVAVMLAAGLAGCAGGLSGGGLGNLFSSGRGPTSMAAAVSGTPVAAVPENAAPSLYCPLVEVRTGTESIAVFERGGNDDPTRLRYQAVLRDTARDCSEGAGGVAVRLGVTGALVGGPKAGGSATAPLRIAVLDAEERVIFSQLYQVGGNIGAPAYRADFVQVVDTILIPGTAQGARIYVGFDSQGR